LLQGVWLRGHAPPRAVIDTATVPWAGNGGH